MPTQDLHSPVGDHHGHIDRTGGSQVGLFVRFRHPFVRHPGGFPGQHPNGIDFGRHFGDHESNGLFLSNFDAEHLALLGVIHRII